jgi:HKD family nuclease
MSLCTAHIRSVNVAQKAADDTVELDYKLTTDEKEQIVKELEESHKYVGQSRAAYAIALLSPP